MALALGKERSTDVKGVADADNERVNKLDAKGILLAKLTLVIVILHLNVLHLLGILDSGERLSSSMKKKQ